MATTGAVRAIVEFLRNAFAREMLPEAPVEAPAPSRRRSLARMIFAPEPLPEDPEAPPRRRRASLLRALFVPEALPEDPVAPPRPRRSWLRWLFVPEPLDPP